MKKIIINGQEYNFFTSSYGGEDMTQFYLGTVERPIWRFKLFSLWEFKSKKMETVPKFVFRLNFNIEDPRITKDKLKEKIDKALAIYNRNEEIQRGEFL